MQLLQATEKELISFHSMFCQGGGDVVVTHPEGISEVIRKGRTGSTRSCSYRFGVWADGKGGPHPALLMKQSFQVAPGGVSPMLLQLQTWNGFAALVQGPPAREVPVLELAHCSGTFPPDPTSVAASGQIPLGQSPCGVREAGQALELPSLPLLISFHQDELQAQSKRHENTLQTL